MVFPEHNISDTSYLEPNSQSMQKPVEGLHQLCIPNPFYPFYSLLLRSFSTKTAFTIEVNRKTKNGKLGIGSQTEGGGPSLEEYGYQKSMKIFAPATTLPLSNTSTNSLERKRSKPITTLKIIMYFIIFLEFMVVTLVVCLC